MDPNDPKARQTYVPASETFEEYMKRRAAQGGKNQGTTVQAKQAVSAAPSYSSYMAARKSGKKDYNVMYLRSSIEINVYYVHTFDLTLSCK